MTTDCNFAVAYARVSTKDQERTGHTLPMQSKNMLEYAQKKGLQIVKDFVVAESASKRDRTYYQEMWGYLGQHPEIKHIIFEEIDRFTRNDNDKVDLADRVNNDGYVAHFVMENEEKIQPVILEAEKLDKSLGEEVENYWNSLNK